MHPQTITSNRKQHARGGVVSYGTFRNEIERTLAKGNVIVTTLIDFFGLPGDFPNYSKDSSKIAAIETAIHADFGNRADFIPYVQRHELEALFFSSRKGFELVIDEPRRLKLIDDIMMEYPNPEDINNSIHTAPSKRMKAIFRYDKGSDAELIIGELQMSGILQKCPRFSQWIARLTDMLARYS